ncbi:MAG: pantoate--beta-alanine ligase, partial [Pyrinomonadaceae bacterium]
GQKDAQQTVIVKRLTQDLGFETEIVALPIVREESGLAMSSRNALLTDEERQKASIIFNALREAKIAARNGERNAANLVEIARRTLAAEPLALVEYVALVDAETLEPVEKIEDRPVLLAVAARFGNVRLIDNTILNRKQ